MTGSVIAFLFTILLLSNGARRETRFKNATPPVVQSPSATTPLVMHCAASTRSTMEPICQQYEQKTGQGIEVQYGGSQSLLSAIVFNGDGDFYLPADETYLTMAIDRGLVAKLYPVATMRPILAVRKGNPKSIHTLEDLFRGDVRLVQADPELAAIGKITRDAMRVTGAWESLAGATIAMRSTVIDVANDITIGAADAGFVFDVVLASHPQLEAVEIDALRSVVSRVSLSLLKTSRKPSVAQQFADYVVSADGGLRVFARHGFQIDGDHAVQVLSAAQDEKE